MGESGTFLFEIPQDWFAHTMIVAAFFFCSDIPRPIYDWWLSVWVLNVIGCGTFYDTGQYGPPPVIDIGLLSYILYMY